MLRSPANFQEFPRHLMIILDSEEDAKVALTSPLRKVGHAMFRLFRYTPEYNPRRESTTTTKWIRLPGLHPGFITKNYVAGIVNSFGHFLDIDERSKACSTLRYTRACVEIDVTKSIPDEVRITLSDGRSFCQRIEVEGNLSFCSHCKIHGHILADCRKKIVPHPVVQNMAREAGDHKKSMGPSSLEATLSGVQEKKGSKAVPNECHEWIEVGRKKGNKTVRFQQISTDKDQDKLPDMVQENSGAESPTVNGEPPGKATVVDNEMEDHGLEKTTGVEEEMESRALEAAVDNNLAIVAVPSQGGVNLAIAVHERGLEAGDNSCDDNTVDRSNASNASTEKDKGEMHSSNLHISKETARKISTYGDRIYAKKFGCSIGSRDIFMHFLKKGVDETWIFKILDDLVAGENQVQQEISAIPLEESVPHDDQVEDVPSITIEEFGNGNEVAPSQIPRLSPQQRTRQKKKKGSRSSNRLCPKKKDDDFVWP